MTCRSTTDQLLTLLDSTGVSPKSIDIAEMPHRVLARCNLKSVTDLRTLAAALKVKKIESTDRRYSGHIELLIAVNNPFPLVVTRNSFRHEPDWDDALALIAGAP